MKNDDFLAKCKNLDPSADVDREKGRIAIKNRLLLEKGNVNMRKNKRMRRPAFVAAVLAIMLSVSAVVYATVPAIWRHFDTRVVQGEEFVDDFWMAEIDMPDGTTSVGGGLAINREALEAAGGGVIIVEVDGEEWVMLDELHLDNLEDGLTLLQLDALLPEFLPEGFAFSKLTFPVNPKNHDYMAGTLRAAGRASIEFVSGNDIIYLQIGYIGTMMGLQASVDSGQQPLFINGNKTVLSHTLSFEEILGLDGVTIYDYSTNWDDFAASIGSFYHTGVAVWTIVDGVAYTLRSETVSLYDLVRMAASMR